MAARLQLPIITSAAHHRPFRRRHLSSMSRICSSTGTGTGTDHHPPASASKKSITTAAASSTWTLKLTYLEINSWVWELQQQKKQEATVVHRILVDPILVGDLDFGAPWLFNGAKKDPKVKSLGVDGLFLAPETTPDLLLITQSLDDHCHVRTLKQLSARAPDLPVVTTPNARPRPRLPAHAVPPRHLPRARPIHRRRRRRTDTGHRRPRAGTTVAAPRERLHHPSYHYRRLRAEVVITPVVKQLLPANFTLVSGQEDAVDLARLLRARYVVPMSNGDVDATGLLATVLTTEGTTHSFKAMLSQVLPQAQVLHATPGVPLQLQLQPQHDN
ncbi:hypothetical protein PR202_gb24450 [Eleusine coracana subsp. coracana]|uniref:Uncharacterized protein n=1 Tax=Eleusine coracana subsp. coracana TaxID=191504 RepID=A0AAV5FML1_ELECO|nr:hypothetical protein PR202_gb24450 [Eleusine coracana subsp. coracana]